MVKKQHRFFKLVQRILNQILNIHTWETGVKVWNSKNAFIWRLLNDMIVWRVNVGLLTGHNSYCGLMTATRVYISYCQKIRCFRRWILCQVLYWFCLYQVQTIPASRKGQHLKDLHGFVSLSDFHDCRDLAFPQGFLSTLKQVLETLKLTLYLSKLPVNA